MRHIKTALQHIRRTPYQSLAATAIATITFFVATFIILLALFSSSLLDYFESQPQITVYFADSKLSGEIEDLQERLRSTGKIERLTFISKEEALRIYQEDHRDDPLLLEMVTAEILPASLEIKAEQAEDLDRIAQMLENEEGIEDVVYERDVVQKLISWTRSLRAMGGILLTVLLVEMLLIILTIIGMRIVQKRRDIKIMQLIGASGWYIRLPFVFEGGLYGLVGGVIGWMFGYGLLVYQSPFISGLLGGVGELRLDFLPQFTVWPLSVELMLIVLSGVGLTGALMGMAGSLIAVHRYLE